MRYRSMFDIIGPAMIGPSSSHTAGANRIGQLARQIYGKTPSQIGITFYGSFAETYQGHGTDRAVIAGLLGMKTDDERIRNALEIAREQNIQFSFHRGSLEGIHPNSVRIELGDAGESLNAVGISLGGGRIELIELNDYNIRLSGDYPTLVLEHVDQVGVIRDLARLLAEHGINISHMEVDRKQRAGQAIAVIEMDQMIDEELLRQIEETKPIFMVKQLEVV
ncbi:L-serine ammonia-lyase, iron-sulfur-dependent subunit beta [Ferviditalea candida]|uniref:L-serine deaminase n=1 Tax=Ferviditalea candida TaxID=3108399 RepID=A0ABU5ZE82_9BACL|nr:L-serine ammonia-lyase, iron-sulfur-dependent subunit beta [Paenibacillaceae bacterium T2]